MKQLIYIAIAFASVSCKSDRPTNIPSIGGDYLVGEWVMDSVVGKKEWKRDWIYFADDNKYWRFSNNNYKYLIDSGLEWRGDSIFSNGLIYYRIIPIDSQSLILDNGNEKFFCKKWGDFDRTDLISFIKADSLKEKINGNWILEKADMFPIEIPSFCNNLKKGAQLHFQSDNTALVLPTDTTGNTYCDKYSYSVSFYEEPELSLTESDMIISYRIIKLTDKELVLVYKHMPMGNLYFLKK